MWTCSKPKELPLRMSPQRIEKKRFLKNTGHINIDNAE